MNTPAVRASAGPMMATQRAREVSQTILSDREMLGDVLEETVASAQDGTTRESGRSVCKGHRNISIHQPKQRNPQSVRFRECDTEGAGIVHSHVTHGELKTPEHSLPDIANVLYTDLDASVVVGTQTADVLHSPSDPQTAQAAFEQAIGIQADSAEAVMDAVHSRKVEDPIQARRRVRDALSPLFETRTTGFPDIGKAVDHLHHEDIIAPAPVTGGGPLVACAVYGHGHDQTARGHDPGHIPERVDQHAAEIHNAMEEAGSAMAQAEQTFNLRLEIASALVGAVATGVVNRYMLRGMFK